MITTREELEKITRQLVKLAIEKRLKQTLKEVAPELPDEILDQVYNSLYRPIILKSANILHKAWKKKNLNRDTNI